MKKCSKIFLNIVLVVVLLLFIVNDSSAVLAENLGNGLNNTLLNEVTSGNSNSTANSIKPKLVNIFGTILAVLKYIGVAGIVLTGVKYMYAGSGDKAAIKQSLIYIIIGTVFLFGADIIIKLIVESWDSTSGYIT